MGAMAGAAATVALTLVALALGARLRAVLRAPVPPGLRLAADLALGCWGLGSAWLALGLAGALTPPWLTVPVLAAVLLGRWRELPARTAALIPAALGAAVLLPIACAPPFFYDALVYHLALPWQALREGRLGPHPESVFAAFPPLAQGLYLPLLAIPAERGPALLHLVVSAVGAAATAALARRLGAPRWAAALTAGAVLLLPGHALVAGLPAAEGFLLLPVVTALALALGSGRGTAPLVGLLLGAATAARLQALPWSLGIAALALLRSRHRLGDGWRWVAAWLVGSAPWWLKNALLLGDPLAPLGWRRPGMETLWRDADSLLGSGTTWAVLPARALHALTPLASTLLPLALAALLALLRDRRGDRRWVAAAVAGGTVAWLITGTLPRFLLPASACLVALAAAAARRFRVAAALSCAAAAVVGLVFSASEVARLGGPRQLLGAGPGERRDLVVNDPLPAYTEARVLPPDSRTLFVGEPRGYGFPRRFVAPSQHDVSPLRPLLEGSVPIAAVLARLAGQGITHLLVNDGELARLAAAYPVAPATSVAGRRRWRELLEALGPPVVATGGVRVWPLPRGPSPV